MVLCSADSPGMGPRTRIAVGWLARAILNQVVEESAWVGACWDGASGS
jgi:hypothetical protein